MALMQVTSPHAHASKQSTSRVMLWVVLATVPGIAALTLAFGWGTVTNIVLATVFGLLLEALAILLRRRPVGFYLGDYSALVTAVLLGIALPPYSSWWLLLLGMFFSIIIAKQLYGGLGYNPFNPAMVGYVVLLISFPVEMTRWAAPLELVASIEGAKVPGLLQSFAIALGTTPLPAIDGFT
ncbi:MAG: RnfABCDGE type electron transport complex subunit D, partial [Pseudomonadales bacterium]